MGHDLSHLFRVKAWCLKPFPYFGTLLLMSDVFPINFVLSENIPRNEPKRMRLKSIAICDLCKIYRTRAVISANDAILIVDLKYYAMSISVTS